MFSAPLAEVVPGSVAKIQGEADELPSKSQARHPPHASAPAEHAHWRVVELQVLPPVPQSLLVQQLVLAMQVPLQSFDVEPEQTQLPAEHVLPPVHAAWFCQKPSEPQTWGVPELHWGAVPGLQLPVQPADVLQI